MRLQNWAAPGVSLRSRLATAALGVLWRPVTQAIPANRAGIAVGRGLLATALPRLSPAVPDSVFEPVEHPLADGPIVRGEWVHSPTTTRTDGIVMYIHGSGYVVCSSKTHRGLTTRISALTGLPVFAADYRLAPSHRFPAASDDVRATWDWLVATGRDPSRIVVAGDSAGGHLAMMLTLELAREGAPLPAALVLLSPVIDLSLRHASERDRISYDPFVSVHAARRLMGMYADETALRHTRLRVDFDDIDEFPPTLIHAGAREMLSTDCTELVRRLRKSGFRVHHRVWPGQIHVFQALTTLVPESVAALQEISDFVGSALSGADEDSEQSMEAAT